MRTGQQLLEIHEQVQELEVCEDKLGEQRKKIKLGQACGDLAAVTAKYDSVWQEKDELQQKLPISEGSEQLRLNKLEVRRRDLVDQLKSGELSSEEEAGRRYGLERTRKQIAEIYEKAEAIREA